MKQKIKKMLTAKEATRVVRVKRPGKPWIWPDVTNAMVSDSFKVLGMAGMRSRAANGDPLDLAFAVNFLESLYRCGYAVVKLDADAG